MWGLTEVGGTSGGHSVLIPSGTPEGKMTDGGRVVFRYLLICVAWELVNENRLPTHRLSISPNSSYIHAGATG